jgi:hypothetical protein
MRLMLVAAALIASSPALSHDFYASSCCGGKDCHPIADPAERSDGYHLRWGQFIAYGDPRILMSPDGHFHGCFSQGKEWQDIICMYVPPRGM